MPVGTPENVLLLLEQGKTVTWIMDYTSWPRRNILAAATRAGLLHNPETDTVSRHHLDDEDEDRPQDLRRPDPPRPAPTPPPPPPGRCSHSQLMSWAAEHGDSTARAAAARIELALEVIMARQAMARAKADERRRRDEARAEVIRQREAAQAEVARLQAALAAARDRARGNQPHPQTVRAWARDAGVACPTRGRVPAIVLVAYEAAHQSGAA